jgi:hypothetical protein
LEGCYTQFFEDVKIYAKEQLLLLNDWTPVQEKLLIDIFVH